jgi:hypothetical protein
MIVPSGLSILASVKVQARLVTELFGQLSNKEVMPDRSLLSSGAGLRATKPVVSKMIVSFPK